ncbi:MAG: radical SAM protein [Candidatus Omnitrophica bacterium]|nr:radical SAM protein [Candidatus Omnitrophota bacterium]
MRKRALVYVYYLIFGGKSPQPEAITLFLTHRCNLRCKMCGQWGESGVTKKQTSQYVVKELDLEVFKGLIDSVASFRPSITLFGGEPLLYARCMDLVRHIKEKKMHCLMITNGSLLDRYGADLVDAGLDELNISLDGARDLHDEIRGMPGLYDKITGGIKEVNKIKKNRGKKKPLINLQCTITRYNYRNLDQMLTVAEDTEADSLTFHNLIFLGRDLLEKQMKFDRLLGSSSLDWEGFIFEPGIEPDVLYNKISDIMSRHRRFSVDFYPNLSMNGLKEYYTKESYLPREYRPLCLSPWMTCYVFPDGEVRPCLNSTYSFGNITQTDLKHIWNSEAAVRFRKILKERGIFPVCVRCTELYRY